MATSLTYTTALPCTYSCPQCYFGATAAQVYSYPYVFLGTVTEIITPYTWTVDYESVLTSYSTSTKYPAPYTTLPSGLLSYSAGSPLTWEVQGVTATLPTTYVQYSGFQRDAFVTATSISVKPSVCVGYKIPTTVQLPHTTIAASFIYPVIKGRLSTTTRSGREYISVPLDPSFLKYLEHFGGLSSIPGLSNIHSCAALRTRYTNGAIGNTCDTTVSTIVIPISTPTLPAYGHVTPPAYGSKKYVPVPGITQILTTVSCSGYKRQQNGYTSTASSATARRYIKRAVLQGPPPFAQAVTEGSHSTKTVTSGSSSNPIGTEATSTSNSPSLKK